MAVSVIIVVLIFTAASQLLLCLKVDKSSSKCSFREIIQNGIMFRDDTIRIVSFPFPHLEINVTIESSPRKDSIQSNVSLKITLNSLVYSYEIICKACGLETVTKGGGP